MRPVATTVLIALVLSTTSASAYEVDTHALITSFARDRSYLTTSDFMQRYGIDRLDSVRPFETPSAVSQFQYDHDGYLDLTPSAWQSGVFGGTGRRSALDYERAQFPMVYRFGTTQSSTLMFDARAWLMRGVVREDDLRPGDYEEGELRPDADPYGSIIRVFHHFYDPVHDQPLQVAAPCSSLIGGTPEGCQRSTDWAMGGFGAASTSGFTLFSGRENHFSWEDARQALMCALTYNRNADRAINSAERRICLATTFLALGHVAHLLQDTAQPQHVRNDRHNPPDGSLTDPLIATDRFRRTYEIWTNFRATAGQDIASPTFERERFADMFRGTVPGPLLTSATYPIPQFSTPVKFFTTRQIEVTSESAPDPAQLIQRRGLADFTNRSFFSEGTVFSTGYPLPPSDDADSSYSIVRYPVTTIDGFGTVFQRELRRTYTDRTAGGYVDSVLASYGNKIPLATESIWFDSGKPERWTNITLDEYSAHADMLIPRAVAYTSGLINHFFRGKLEVTAPTDRIIAVANQGENHTVDGSGYPHKTSNGAIFGFEKVRLKIRNATDPILEAGTAESFPQYVGAAGSLQGQLVAVARYHRNVCYRPDLSGERVQNYSTGSMPNISEPVCDGNHPVRSGYEEISVSAPLTITAPDTDSASELDNLAAGAGVEKLFDFSADPIPVNASDLFIQVVYRGRMGKEHDSQARANNAEADAIAVGTFDVREPTFVAFWNNSDYFWSVGANPPQWLPWNVALYPHGNVFNFSACAGGAPVKLVYEFIGATGSVAMKDPVVNANAAGFVRLAMVFPPPAFAGQLFSVRAVPSFDNTNTSSTVRSTGGFLGVMHQANKDFVQDATLGNPSPFCNTALPTSPEYWCWDPVQRRRGQIFGAQESPIYRDTGGGATAGDVDAQPLPLFAGQAIQPSGTVRFNTDATLQGCPNPPSAPQTQAEQIYLELLELQEHAYDLGIDVPK